MSNGLFTDEVIDHFPRRHLSGRLHLQGVLDRRQLADVYRAMDVFAFASKTETQGIVLVEAMASGTPVVAVDAPGVREIVRDGENGRLLQDEDPGLFAAALEWMASRPPSQKERMLQGALRTADDYSIAKSARKMLELYMRLTGSTPVLHKRSESRWGRAQKQIRKEFDIMRIYGQAAEDAVFWTPLQKK